MEGKLHNFEALENTRQQFDEIKNRYKTAEGISETLVDQVQKDYNTIRNLSPNNNISQEEIETLLKHMKDIYPDVGFTLEESLFPHKNVEEDILKSIKDLD